MADLESKQYFIKDTSLEGIDDDLFNYADISKVLERILESNEPPFNIAIIGKWGLGKSSLINLVKNKLIVDKKYLFQEINAWKYEKESLRRVFLKQLWQGISGEKLKSFQEIQRIFSDIINSNISQDKPIVKPKWNIRFWNRLCETGRNLLKYCLPAAGIVLFTIVAFVVYKCIQAHTYGVVIDLLFWWKAVLSYCKNIGTTLLLPVLIALLTALHSEYRKKEPKQFELKFPLETADDYELFLENAIADKLKDVSNLKIVTIIDDLDRLSLDKIVEALDSIKAFVNLSNCVFIVPFDDEIIKSALEKKRETQFGEYCEVIESELILDKLFQFKIYLPPLLKHDIGDYTMKLVNREISDFIKDYCPVETLNRLINRILIHSDVSTPRQVKKLINAFVNNYLIAREREESGRVVKGLLTGERGIEQIAKLSVLQADFNRFYDLLFTDFTFITKFVEIAQSRYKGDNIPKELCEYFLYKGETNEEVFVKVLPIYEPLLNFLIRTEKYSVENIAPFIYLAQSAISIKTGDENQRRAIAALESGNGATLKTMLDGKPEIAEAIIAYIPDCKDAELPLQAAYPLLASVSARYEKPLANVLVGRSIEADINMSELSLSLSPDDVFAVSKQAERTEHGTLLTEKYLSAIANEKTPNSDAIIDMLRAYIPEFQALSTNARESLRQAAHICCSRDEQSVKSILPLLDYSNTTLFTILWGTPWFYKLCTHISYENDYTTDTRDSLAKSFALLSEKDFSAVVQYSIPLFNLPPLLDTLDVIFSCEFCSQLDTSQATEIANTLVTHKYDRDSRTTQLVHELLHKLKYAVDDKNAEVMTVFTENYKTSAMMDDVLVYMGEKGFFPYIEATLSSLVSAVFDNDKNDELLGKISRFLTKTSREKLFALLNQKTAYASKDYKRELAILFVLSADGNNSEHIEALATTTLIPNLSLYNNQLNYVDFVMQVMGAIKALLQQSTIDNYINKLVSYFASKRASCLRAFELLPGIISVTSFAKVFPLVTNNIADSEFEQALKILIDNDNVRPTGDAERIAYREFLTSHLEKATNPNAVLQTLRNSFGYFSDMKSLTESALNNTSTDRKLLVDVIVKCFNNYKSADIVASEALPMFSITGGYAILQESFAKLTAHSLDDVFAALSEKLDWAMDIDALVNIALYAAQYNSTQAKDVYLKVLTLSLEHDNVPDKLVKIISVLSDFNQSIRIDFKDDFIAYLHTGFTRTTSDSVLQRIVSMVRAQKWTKQFKKMLKDNTDKLDLFDKLAK